MLESQSMVSPELREFHRDFCTGQQVSCLLMHALCSSAGLPRGWIRLSPAGHDSEFSQPLRRGHHRGTTKVDYPYGQCVNWGRVYLLLDCSLPGLSSFPPSKDHLEQPALVKWNIPLDLGPRPPFLRGHCEGHLRMSWSLLLTHRPA